MHRPNKIKFLFTSINTFLIIVDPTKLFLVLRERKSNFYTDLKYVNKGSINQLI